MEKYKLVKSNRYVIYGAAFMGKQVLKGLQDAGYNVEAFLDKRAEKLKEVNGIKVLHPDDYDEQNKDDIVIIVAITNVFEQPQVAAYLIKKGYKKIICKLSADNSFSDKNAKTLFDIYENILVGKVNSEDELGELSEDCQDIYFEDCAIVKELNPEELVVMIPVELCHAGGVHMPEKFIGRNEEFEESPDTLLLYSQAKIINLFRAFEGNISGVKIVMDEFRDYFFKNPGRYYSFDRTEQGFIDFISNRFEIYVRMSQLLNNGIGFFVNVPIDVEWNDKGYFNVIDGNHRVSFFIAKGFHHVPAKIKREDYLKWKNEEKLNQCIDYMKKMDCLPAYAPIPHPNFYNYPTRRDTTGLFRLQQICSYLYYKKINVKGLSVIDLGSYFSYFAQAFTRMGANVTTVEYYDSSYEAGILLNELLYCGNINAVKEDVSEISLDKEFDITIMLTVFYSQMETEKGLRTLNNVDCITRNLLLWESGGEAEKEIKYILEHTSFKRYEKICETYGTGLIREIGAFYK